MSISKIGFKSLILLAVLTFSPASRGNSSTQPEPDDRAEEIDFVDSKDKEINNAKQKAIDTYDEFLETWKSNQNNPKYEKFTVKLGFASAVFGKEHMWVGDLQMDGDTVKGILLDTSIDSSIKYKEGDLVTINKKNISDWMYVEIKDDGKAVTKGAYSVRVYRDRMSPEEKAEFDNTSGMYLED